MVDEFADGDRSGTASAETQEEKEKVMCVWTRDDFSESVLVKAAGEIVDAETTDS